MERFAIKTSWKLVVYTALICLFAAVFAHFSMAYADDSAVKEKTREINIVYDDSGSMFSGTTAWSEAKYAVEVFAAMMGENDIVNIFPMSNYDYPITLLGNENPQNNVSIVNQMSDSGGTPFGAVQAAGNALMMSEADEKWLVIFTDGYFDVDIDESTYGILSYVGQNNAKVVYTAIGSDAVDLSYFATEMFYPYTTEGSSILNTMTDIAARVFNYQAIPLSGVGTGTVTFSADVPLSKLIVFAQGEGVSVGSVQVNSTALQDYTDSTIDVRVDKNSGGASRGTVASGLNGVVYSATANTPEKPFRDGTYSFNCNTDNVQVFVEPGISVEAVLQNAHGEKVTVGTTSSGTVTEGEWTVAVDLVNPLTGAVIDATASSILTGAVMDVVVTFDDGTVQTYSDGDTISVVGSEIELYGRTTYNGLTGKIEKTSQIHTLKVEKSPLVFTFSAPGGYDLDAVMLSPDTEMTFTVTLGTTPLTAEQASDLKLKVEDTQGIEWTIESVNNTGTFRLVPNYSSKKGLNGVTAGKVPLEISGSVTVDGEKRKGTGTVNVNILTESKSGLALTLTMPPEQSFDDSSAGKYMFDATLLGVPESGEERPYIVVSVQATDANGGSRPLSDDEWAAGVDCFSFDAKGIDQPWYWKVIQGLTIGGQNLTFDVVQGPEPSTYKLYLSGLSELNVLPNTSDLEVQLTFRYDNGAALQGSQNGTVTVKPLAWWSYILYFLVLLLIFGIVLLIVICELTKPRIPKDFRPVVTTECWVDGAVVGAEDPRHFAKIKREYTLRPRKPEECNIVFYSGDTQIRITFKVVATGRGCFRFVDGQLKKFNAVRDTVKFIDDKKTYEYLSNLPSSERKKVEFEQNDTITYESEIGQEHYRVKLTF